MSNSQKSKTKYWYKFYHGECPICGKDKSRKERVTDRPKPIDPKERHVVMSDTETYDYCMEY